MWSTYFSGVSALTFCCIPPAAVKWFCLSKLTYTTCKPSCLLQPTVSPTVTKSLKAWECCNWMCNNLSWKQCCENNCARGTIKFTLRNRFKHWPQESMLTGPGLLFFITVWLNKCRRLKPLTPSPAESSFHLQLDPSLPLFGCFTCVTFALVLVWFSVRLAGLAWKLRWFMQQVGEMAGSY